MVFYHNETVAWLLLEYKGDISGVLSYETIQGTLISFNILWASNIWSPGSRVQPSPFM